MTKPIIVGFAGPIELASSRHATWIGRAVEIASDRLARTYLNNVELKCVDDGASAIGGRTAAVGLIQSGVQVVAGHYSSAAAAAALPYYREGGALVVLAGATVDELTRQKTVFRVCDNETAYAKWLTGVIRSLGLESLQILAQDSEFGRRLATAVAGRLPVSAQGGAKSLLIVGQSEFAKRALLGIPRKTDRHLPILLTDDTQHPRVVAEIAEIAGVGARIMVAGFTLLAPEGEAEWALEQCRVRWGELPGAFFWETIAAIQVAGAMAVRAPAMDKYITVLGELAFDASGEANPRRFCLFEWRDGALQPALLPTHQDIDTGSIGPSKGGI